MKIVLRPVSLLVGLHLILLGVMAYLLVKNRGEAPVGADQIVVIPIGGVISTENPLDHGLTVDDLVDTLHDLRDDDSVKAVVLAIDSPGGSVGSVQQIYAALQKFHAKGKIIVSSFGEVAASGGYYIAAPSDKIICQPGTLTGSIGVIMEMPNVQGLLTKVGVNMDVVKSGSMKDSGSPFRKMTDDERSYFHTLIMDAYGQFFQAVQQGRKIDPAALKPLADGRVFSGSMAVQNHLADRLGDLEDAIDVAKDLSGLKDKNPDIVFHHPRPTLERFLDTVMISPVKELTQLRRQHSRLLYLLQ